MIFEQRKDVSDIFFSSEGLEVLGLDARSCRSSVIEWRMIMRRFDLHRVPETTAFTLSTGSSSMNAPRALRISLNSTSTYASRRRLSCESHIMISLRQSPTSLTSSETSAVVGGVVASPAKGSLRNKWR